MVQQNGELHRVVSTSLEATDQNVSEEVVSSALLGTPDSSGILAVSDLHGEECSPCRALSDAPSINVWLA